MKKLLFIILLFSSFFASAQGVRSRDSTLSILHNPPLNTLVPTYSFITPLYKQVMASHNLAQDSMVVFNPITQTYGYRTIPSGGGGSSQWTTTGSDIYYNTGGVGIGATSVNSVSLLELTSTTKGFRLPRMTSAQRTAITAVSGLLVFDTDSASAFQYTGSAWQNLYSAGGGGGTPAGSTEEIQVNVSGAFGAYDRFKFSGGSNISKLTIKEGSSQSTNHLTQWTTTADAVRTAITYDHALMLTQPGGYNQYIGVESVASLPGSITFKSYSGDYWATNTDATNIKFLASGTQKFIYASPVKISSGTANPLEITSYGALTSFLALQNGGVSLPQALAIGYVEKTGTYTADLTNHVINCTSGTFTVTLPLANSYAGLMYTIINSGAGAITVGTTSSQTINGSTTYSLPAQYDWVTVISDGVSKWYIKSKNGGSGGTTRIDQLLAATATNTINNVAYNQEWEWNSLATGAGLSLSSTSTAASSNPTLLSVGVSGANASASKTTYASSLYNIHTGTTSTNIGQDILVENGTTNIGLQVVAQGGTNNYAALFGAGNVGIGEATPTAYLHLAAATATAGTGQLKFNSSTLPTTPEVGLMNMKNGLWFIDSSNSNRDTIATREWTSTYVGTDTTRIVTGPTGYTATAYSPRSTFMYEKAVRYTIGDSVVHSDRITTTDSTASFDLPTYMPVQVIGTSGTNATTNLATYTTPSGYIGVYEIGLKIKPTAVSGGVLTTVVTYQDDVNATVTYTMITTGALSTLTTTGTFHYPTIQIAAYADSEIKITSTLTVGTMTYNAYGTITYVRKVPI